MESTLKNMAAVLFGITLIASAGVGVVNMITEKPIAEAKEAATTNAVSTVLTDIDFDRIAEADTMLNVKNCTVIIYRAMKDEQVAAYAVQTPSLTKDGFNGKVTLMVGYTPEGLVNNVAVVEQNETPGLGTNMTKPDNNLYRSVVGKNTWEQRQKGALKVTKEGGEVDALTAATISSKAYVNAIESANAAFRLARQADMDKTAEEEKATIDAEEQKGGQHE